MDDIGLAAWVSASLLVLVDILVIGECRKWYSWMACSNGVCTLGVGRRLRVTSCVVRERHGSKKILVRLAVKSAA